MDINLLRSSAFKIVPVPTTAPPNLTLRRTSLNQLREEPSFSYFRPCRIASASLVIHGYKNYENGHNACTNNKLQAVEVRHSLICANGWSSVDWKIDPCTLNIFHWPTPDLYCILKLEATAARRVNVYDQGSYEFVRLQFSAVTMYCILKLKALAARRVRRRFIRALLPDAVPGRNPASRSAVGTLLATWQRAPIRRRVAAYLLGN